jgi:Tfp pilus assembly protein PilO
VITPLVILLLDFGKQTSWTLIVDRLIAILVGCALVLTLGYLIWLKLLPQERVAVKAKA